MKQHHTIVVKDRKSSAYFSTSLDSKTSHCAVAFVAGAIQELGYKRILMKSDNEPAIKRLKEFRNVCQVWSVYPKKRLSETVAQMVRQRMP